MSRFSSGLIALFDELKRRHVFRVAAAYVFGAFVVLQGADLLIQGLPVPAWVYPTLTVLTLVGFPVVLVLAWLFEWTAHGIRREKESAPPAIELRASQPSLMTVSARPNSQTVRAFAFVGLGIVVAIVVMGLSLPYMDARRESGASLEGRREGVVPVSSERAATLAVLPFASLTGGNDDGFADGLAEDVTAALAQLGGVNVVSRTTSEAYRNSDKTARTIGAELGVGLILEGTIRRAGDRVRVTVQLIDATTDRHLWAQSYDRELTGDVFGTQSELAQEIVAAIQSVVMPEQAEDAERQLRAVRFTDAGSQLLERADPYVDAEAEQMFAQALEVDAHNPVAHAGIAQTLLTRAQNGPPALLDSAEAHAELAIRLDPALPEAHAAHAFVLLVKGELDSANDALRRAIELDESGEGFAYEWQERIRMISPEMLANVQASFERIESGTRFEMMHGVPAAPPTPAVGAGTTTTP